MSQSKVILQAQKYIIHNGWSVIPAKITLNEEGKKIVHVNTPYWDKDKGEKGLDDPLLVTEVFRNATAIGIVTGFRSNLTVIDLDTNKETGELETPLNSFPATYTVKTRSGGYHLYYQYYSEMLTGSDRGGDKYPHIDIRNDGGFVFAPPSMINDEVAYTILNEMDPQPFPVEHFRDVKSAKKTTEQYKGLKAIKTFTGMEEGERDTALFTFAQTEYSRNALKDWPIVDLLIQTMNNQMRRPLPQQDVQKIILSARKYQNVEEKKLEFITDAKGNPSPVLNNVVKVLEQDERYTNIFRYNTFSGDVEHLRPGARDWSIIDITDETKLRLRLSEDFPFLKNAPVEHITKAIAYVAHKKEVSPPVEYLQSLTWDKKPRLSQWIVNTFPVQDNEYYQEMGKNFIIAMVNRLVHPGCQMDNVMVLDSGEGQGKSRSLRILSTMGSDIPYTFNETSDSPEGKDFVQNIMGTTITEFSEGAVVNFKDRKKVKAFITKVKDKYRPPYERSPLNFPRQCVFAMSTNDSQYIEDGGKNRRWWPVILDRSDDAQVKTDWLKENLQQIFAEAYERRDEHYWEFTEIAEQQLEDIRNDKRVEDEVHYPIFTWYMGLSQSERDKGITKLQGWEIIYGKENKQKTNYDLKLIGEYYTDRLYLQNGRFEGKRVFLPTAKTPPPLTQDDIDF